VAADFPVGVARRLERAGVAVTVARDALFPERAVKSAAELRRLRESQQAAVLAMRAAQALIQSADAGRDGRLESRRTVLTAEAVRETIARTLLAHDCFCRDTIVAGGDDGADPHEQGSGPLREGEPIVIDIFPQHNRHGYWGDLTRTVLRGKASPALRKLYQAVRAAQNAALSHVKPGVKCATVHNAAVEEFARRGYTTRIVDGRPEGFIHSTGHGVGLSVHEAPSVGPTDTRLRSGHVVTIEPGLYYPGLGGVRIEDTVAVTPTGWRYLVPCEKRFEL
jgi:Xaa-Pro aminopeptidase